MNAHTDISGNILWSKVPAFRLIDKELDRVKELMNEQLTTSAEAGALGQLLEYVNARSGKLIRPGLVLLAGSCCGKITDKHIIIAAVVEMIHNATLLHDDVIDKGQSRRGQPTINSLWGNESAVLLGDFLLSRVFKMCAELEPQITKVIAGTAARVCEGELRQIAQSRNWQLSESQYIDIITEKSASVFSSCCYLGGLLAQGTQTQLQSLSRFGLNAGIAFQITDDLLDIIGDENKTGKTLGSDVDKSKLTLPVIHLLKMIDERGKSEIIEKLNAKRGSTELAEVYTLYPNFIEMLKTYGSLEYARRQAQEFVTKAIQSLTGLKESEAKEALIETAKFMASRAV